MNKLRCLVMLPSRVAKEADMADDANKSESTKWGDCWRYTIGAFFEFCLTKIVENFLLLFGLDPWLLQLFIGFVALYLGQWNLFSLIEEFIDDDRHTWDKNEIQLFSTYLKFLRV